MIPEENVSSLFNRHIRAADSPEERIKTARHWFVSISISEARRLAARETIVRFWQRIKEPEGAWLEKAKTRIQIGINRHLQALLETYKFNLLFFEKLAKAMEDTAEESLIYGIVPYEWCFRRAKIKDYLRWFAGYKDKKNGYWLPISITDCIREFRVAIYPFRVNPLHEKTIIIPRQVPLPNPKAPLGENILYIMDGHKVRSKSPAVFIFKDMEAMVEAM